MFKIMCDPGHGGTDTGAIGPTGTKEKDINLSVCLILKDLLSLIPDIEVNLTRETDESLPLAVRTKMANDWGADLFLSVHCNGNRNPKVSGIETFYHVGSEGGKAAAKIIQHSMASCFPECIDRGIYADTRDTKHGFYVLRNTRMKAVLVEMEFLTNPEKEAVLVLPAYQRRVAVALCDGIGTYLLGRS